MDSSSLKVFSSIEPLDDKEEIEEDDEEEDEEDKHFDIINLKRARVIEKRLFSNWPTSLGVQISRDFRETIKIENFNPESIQFNKYNIYTEEASTFYYTEIHPRSFLKLLESLRSYNFHFPEDSVFIDGTSGLGKTLIIATISNLFKNVRGIELNLELVKLSKDLIKKFHNNFRTPVDAALIDVIHTDITNYRDLSQVNVFYLFATFFTFEMMQKIEKNLLTMTSGNALLLAGNRISSRNSFIPSSIPFCTESYINVEEYFDLVTTFKILFAGGVTVPIFLYRRNAKEFDLNLMTSKDSFELKESLEKILNKSYGI